MNQGNSVLWASSDQGNTWTRVARANEESESSNSIRDVANTIYSNNRGSVLYGALGGAAGGLESSTDGGVKWTLSSIQTNRYGGSPEYMSMFGATSAIFGIESGPQYRTLNGKRWDNFRHYRPENIVVIQYARSVRALKRVSVRLSRAFLRPPSTIQWCSQTAETSLAISTEFQLLNPWLGRRELQWVSRRFPRRWRGRGGFVTLRPHGGRASIVFERESATTYSRSYCAPKVMEGIKINFARPSAFYARIPRAKVCTGVSTVNVGGVVSGLTSWL